MKAVSVSAELATIQKRPTTPGPWSSSIGRADSRTRTTARTPAERLRELGGAAILALASCRIRDLDRAGRGSLDVENLLAPHNIAVDVTDVADLVLFRRRRRGAGIGSEGREGGRYPATPALFPALAV